MFKSITPLSLCLIISTIANMATAAMVAWFLIVKPYVRVTGGVSVHGDVHIDGGTVEVKNDKNAIQKVMICEETYELSKLPQFPVLGERSSSQLVPVTRCASLSPSGPYGSISSYGLSVIPPHNP